MDAVGTRTYRGSNTDLNPNFRSTPNYYSKDMHMACKSCYSHPQRAKKLYDISNNTEAKCEENLFDIDPGYV